MKSHFSGYQTYQVGSGEALGRARTAAGAQDHAPLVRYAGRCGGGGVERHLTKETTAALRQSAHGTGKAKTKGKR